MGFMGISRVGESDNAFDLNYTIDEAMEKATTLHAKQQAFIRTLVKEYNARKKGYASAKQEWDSNPYNTPVCIDVALIAKEHQQRFKNAYDSKLVALMKKVEKDLENVKDVKLSSGEEVMPLYVWFKNFVSKL
jgi:hypothetical protein